MMVEIQIQGLEVLGYILDLTTSLDGFIEGKNRKVGWVNFDDEIGKDLLDFADEIDTVLFGWVSYGVLGNYQPGMYFRKIRVLPLIRKDGPPKQKK